MLTIGDTEFETKSPDDLDARLIAASGCDAAETARMIRERPLPFAVARAAAALMTEPAPLSDLASLIEANDALSIAKDVADLLTAPVEVSASPALSIAEGDSHA